MGQGFLWTINVCIERGLWIHSDAHTPDRGMCSVQTAVCALKPPFPPDNTTPQWGAGTRPIAGWMYGLKDHIMTPIEWRRGWKSGDLFGVLHCSDQNYLRFPWKIDVNVTLCPWAVLHVVNPLSLFFLPYKKKHEASYRTLKGEDWSLVPLSYGSSHQTEGHGNKDLRRAGSKGHDIRQQKGSL